MAGTSRQNNHFGLYPGCTVPSPWNLVGKKALVLPPWDNAIEELARLGASVYAQAIPNDYTQFNYTATLQQLLQAGLLNIHVSCAGTHPAIRFKEQGIKELMADVSQHFGGRLDILVIGIPAIDAATREYPVCDVQSDFVSTIMYAFCEKELSFCKLAYPLLKASGDGRIIFKSCISGCVPIKEYQASYASARAALNQLTKNLACEWAADNIRVNAVAQGFIQEIITLEGDINFMGMYPVLARIPLRRIAKLQEIASAVAFMCLPCSSYITGVILPVDGGLSAHCIPDL